MFIYEKDDRVSKQGVNKEHAVKTTLIFVL